MLLISDNQDPARGVGQHRNVIAAAKTAGVKRFVFTSVQGTERAPDASVGTRFRQTEDDLKTSGMKRATGRAHQSWDDYFAALSVSSETDLEAVC